MVTPLALALAQAERRLLARLSMLGARLDADDDATAWGEYLATLTALVSLVPAERRPLWTTRELAERLNLSPKAVRAAGKRDVLQSVRLGQRGKGAIRWRA